MSLTFMSGMRMGCNSMCNKRIVVDEISDDLSANIIFFGYMPAGGVARWVTCRLTAKHKAACYITYINTKKAF